ncbi:hypothetical protein H2O73_00825 [Vibrio sp. 404]|uniref:Uncharacterized protein n=1 Tax=Vibrio marinisediminis TaxID=2758441 RepID=A0A7W2IS94_9VIBR|nr:hypothetical protein [Vibrio marinisediminis]MBA5760868.1 hypothetical protein [Vibrio marinisediminis]
MKNSKYQVIEIILIVTGCALAIIWVFNPEGTYEPVIVLIGLLVSLVAVWKSVRLVKNRQVVESLNEPKQSHAIKTLLDRKSSVFVLARKKWDSGITSNMRSGTEDVISFYSSVWLQLAKNFPSDHFGKLSHSEYLDEYISERYEFYYEQAKRDDCGEGAMAFVIVSAGVMKDLDAKIIELVSIISLNLDSFDFGHWLQKWKLSY